MFDDNNPAAIRDDDGAKRDNDSHDENADIALVKEAIFWVLDDKDDEQSADDFEEVFFWIEVPFDDIQSEPDFQNS